MARDTGLLRAGAELTDETVVAAATPRPSEFPPLPRKTDPLPGPIPPRAPPRAPGAAPPLDDPRAFDEAVGIAIPPGFLVEVEV